MSFEQHEVLSNIWTEEWERTYPVYLGGEPYFTLELIPSGAGGVNLRTRLKKDEWDKIRRYVYKQANYRCELCGQAGDTYPVECHEIWRWRYARAIPQQRLFRCAALCPKCHQGKHLGLTKQMKTQVQYARIVSHIKKLNRWVQSDFDAYLLNYLVNHDFLRSIPKWRLSIAWARGLLKELK
jgi:hypothetical protein